jgi:acetyl esterase/lipase
MNSRPTAEHAETAQTGADRTDTGSTGAGWTDTVWRPVDGLRARIYRPAGDPPVWAVGAAVVDVHGGAWASRDLTLGHTYNLTLAAAGLTVVAVDFRDGRQARHPAAVDDVADAVRWVQEGAGLDVDPERLALTGSSSGGHLALHAALTHLDDTPPALVAALWPPVDPLGRYRYARSMVGRPVPPGNRLDAAGLVASTEAYFGDEAAMERASIAGVVRSGRARHLPPVWLAEAGADLNVPAALLDDLVLAYRDAGGTIERTVYPDEIHGFGHGPHPGAERFRADLTERLRVALRPRA